MTKFKLVQTRFNGTRTKVIETNVIDTFATKEQALDYLSKRDFTFDNVAQAYIRGNAVQAPVTIEAPVERGLFDIRSFV